MDWIKKFFQVYIEKQTYFNLFYLLLAFPLGLAYFIFLLTGLSLGLGLLIVWVGLFVLLLVYAVWYGMLAFERILAISLLNEKIPPMLKKDLTGKSLWQKFTATLGSAVTWKGLFFLLLKLPMGLISFCALTVLGSLSAALLAAPLYYNNINSSIQLTLDGNPVNAYWIVDTLPEAVVACLLGFLILTASLHLFNALARLSGKIAYGMLGDFSSPPQEPQLEENQTTEPSLVVEKEEDPQANG